MVEPQGLGREEQALMLEAKDPAPATQAVSTSLPLVRGPLLTFYLLVPPTQMAFTTNRWSETEGKH